MSPKTLVLPFLVLSLASPAEADRGERALGLEVSGGYPPAGRAALVFSDGLSDWAALRLAGGFQLPRIDEGVLPEGLATAAIVIAIDVVEWVPEISLGAGGAFGETGVRGRITGRAGVRKFLAMDWSLDLGISGEWTPPADGVLLGSIGIWWHFADGR